MFRLKILLSLIFFSSACLGEEIAEKKGAHHTEDAKQINRGHSINLLKEENSNALGYIHGNGILPAISYAPIDRENIAELNAKQIAQIVFDFVKVVSLIDPSINRSNIQNQVFKSTSRHDVYKSVLVPSVAVMELSVLYGQPHISALLNPIVYRISPSIGNMIMNTLGSPTKIDLKNFGSYGVPGVLKDILSVPGVLEGWPDVDNYICKEYCLYVEALKNSFSGLSITKTTEKLQETMGVFLENYFNKTVSSNHIDPALEKYLRPNSDGYDHLNRYDGALYKSLVNFDIDPWILDRTDYDLCVQQKKTDIDIYNRKLKLNEIASKFDSFKQWIQFYITVEKFRNTNLKSSSPIKIGIRTPIEKTREFDDGVSDPPYTEYEQLLQSEQLLQYSKNFKKIEKGPNLFEKRFIYHAFNRYFYFYEKVLDDALDRYLDAYQSGFPDPGIQLPSIDYEFDYQKPEGYSSDVLRQAENAAIYGRETFWWIFESVKDTGKLNPSPIDNSKYVQCAGVRPTTLPQDFSGSIYFFGFDGKSHSEIKDDGGEEKEYYYRPSIHTENTHGIERELDIRKSQSSMLSNIMREDIGNKTLHFEVVFDEAFAPIQGLGNGMGIVVFFCDIGECENIREKVLEEEREIRKKVFSSFENILGRGITINDYMLYREFIENNSQRKLELTLLERKKLEDNAYSAARRIASKVFNEIMDNQIDYSESPDELRKMYERNTYDILINDEAILELQSYFKVFDNSNESLNDEKKIFIKEKYVEENKSQRVHILPFNIKENHIREDDFFLGGIAQKGLPWIKNFIQEEVIRWAVTKAFKHAYDEIISEWNEITTTSERWLDYVAEYDGSVSFDLQLEAGKGCYGECTDERGMTDLYDGYDGDGSDGTYVSLLKKKRIVFELFK